MAVSATARLSFECLDERIELHAQGLVVSRHRRDDLVDTKQLINGHLGCAD